MADFKAVKASIPLERAAKLLNLDVHRAGHQLRGPCPACQNEDPRILALTPDKGVYFCHEAQIGGSVIDLAAHILGLSVKDAAEWLSDTLPHSREATAPQKTERGKQPSPTSPKEFDAEAFGKKLVYSEEVEAFGVNEEDAVRLGIGWHPSYKRVYVPVRHGDGSIAGFIGIKDASAVKLPPKWDAPRTNVVALRRA